MQEEDGEVGMVCRPTTGWLLPLIGSGPWHPTRGRALAARG